MRTEYNPDIQKAVASLKQGEIIAYPTESVYGLGCDPFNAEAIAKLLQLKNRSMDKGFILIAADWRQVEPLVQPVAAQALARALNTWPGPTTWLFPKQPNVPYWIYGKHNNIAIRVTDHPVASLLCYAFAGPIISTSANEEGFPPIRDQRTLEMTFGKKIDCIVSGSLGNRTKPSEIRDVISGEIIRAG